MVLRMPRPTARRDSSRHQLKLRVPADIRERARGLPVRFDFPANGNSPEHCVVVTLSETVRCSLATSDEAVGRQRQALALAHLETVWQNLRTGPATLSQRRINALSGEVYRLFKDRFEENPGTPEMWIAVKAFNRATREGRVASPPLLSSDIGDAAQDALNAFGADMSGAIDALPRIPSAAFEGMERRFGWLTDWVLARYGEVVDADSRARLLLAVERASTDAAVTLKRYSRDDYSPDPVEQRFVPLEPPAAVAVVSGAGSFEDVFATYVRVPGKHGSRSARTIRSYRSIFVEEFGGFVQKERKLADPLRVSRADIAAWRDHLLGTGLSAKTISAKKLACVRAVYERQVADGALAANPASGTLIGADKKQRNREKGFTDAEAKAILSASLSVERGRRVAASHRALQWLPWLMAYSGARVAEVAQLRGSDVRKEADGWVMRLKPEAGSTKSGIYRDVPVHADLVERGFLAMIDAVGAGPLFINDAGNQEKNSERAKAAGGRLSEWVRGVVGVTDTEVQPNHGWRHRFVTRARAAGIDHEKREYIVGHRLPGLGDTYGDMGGLRAEMDKYPKKPLG